MTKEIKKERAKCLEVNMNCLNPEVIFLQNDGVWGIDKRKFEMIGNTEM